MTALSEWLQLMLAEIARKREELERARAEEAQRLTDSEAARQGAEVADGVRAGRFEARPDRRRCRLCPYRLVCAEAL